MNPNNFNSQASPLADRTDEITSIEVLTDEGWQRIY